MTLTAQVPTSSAGRYLQQLCKHWSHKFETDFDAATGSIAFPMGAIRLAAGADTLTVTIEPQNGADVERFKQVVADHLDRFAFREAPLHFDWR
ncbi:hypothetical protein J3E64_000477 [Sphingobium sp. OAS761]|uniref:DUF2218 domain-containing protein n=1 Tax=Sphingobium sp. OAS761 TaxID=2817901 RepID=UPI00209DAA7E|nr:DUF2218 domain-containing protein [Sphingobium sp. OAS761]MCP1468810.1 hypothetical protein [Sphingobium sp. OAS761]